jgi:hypothetical protein
VRSAAHVPASAIAVAGADGCAIAAEATELSAANASHDPSRIRSRTDRRPGLEVDRQRPFGSGRRPSRLAMAREVIRSIIVETLAISSGFTSASIAALPDNSLTEMPDRHGRAGYPFLLACMREKRWRRWNDRNLVRSWSAFPVNLKSTRR